MQRVVITSLFATIFAALLTACNKTPSPAAAPSMPAAAPVAAAPAVVTYDCHSEQKGRDIFMRFGADGALYLGADAADMKATGDIVLFDKGGVATWGKKNGSWTETNIFDKNKAEYDWTNDPGPEGLTDHAHYLCKAV